MEPLQDQVVGLALVHSRGEDDQGVAMARSAGADTREGDLLSVLDAASPRQLTVILTVGGALAVAVFQVVYALFIQGWGTPLP